MNRRIVLAGAVMLLACAPWRARSQKQGQVEFWLTTPDRAALFAEQATPLRWQKAAAAAPTITVDDHVHYQTMEGFGFALTGGSAELLMRMTPGKRTALLKELFQDQPGSIGVSYLRVSIGSSDMNARVFTYDDMPAGQKDSQLTHFSLGPDREDVIPVLKEILAIAPRVTILASPWSAPSWMKSNGAPKGGSLLEEDYAVYARYLVKYVQAMAAEGITIHAITVQNEPLNTNNTPSLEMFAPQQDAFIRDALGPALRAAGLTTQIIVYDHNLDKPEYPLEILADAAASQYVAGSGFHLYAGDVAAMTRVHDAHPDKGLYFTEQMVIDQGKEAPLTIAEPVSRVVIGATRNWARNVLLWNLAADPENGPHTANGGCPVCEGAVTLDGDNVARNVAFYTIAHAARFVRPGSVRIQSIDATDGKLAQVAFETPDHSKVLLVANTTDAPYLFSVVAAGREFTSTLGSGAAATYVWR